MTEDTNYISKGACDNCGSSDANAFYDDGHYYCFSCEHYTPPPEESIEKPPPKPEVASGFVAGTPQALPKRRISADTCRFWDYLVGNHKGKPVQIANYKDDKGNTVAQKLRFANKEFSFIGKFEGLYGQHLWGDGGKMVVITEGEIDALSVSQLLQNQWPVVSLPHGASSAVRSITKSLEWLEKFDSILLCFDQDEAGRKAAEDAAQLFTPGKAKVVTLPRKDANEMLVHNEYKKLSGALWQAKVYRPDGILEGSKLWDLVSTVPNNPSIAYPYLGLNEMTQGMRRGEVITVSAGTGIGKSQFTKELAYHLIKEGETLGLIALEENVRRTALGIMSIAADTPFHLERDEGTEELEKAFKDTLGTGRVYLYDHWGSIDPKHILNKIRYMAVGCKCGWIILDHISIVVSGLDEGDERKMLDTFATNLRTLVAELQIGLILVSHLKRPAGDKGHEDGAKTSLNQIRGTTAIGGLSDTVLGLERDQQSADNAHKTFVRVLKNRYTGDTGVACALEYSKETGRMIEGNVQDDKEYTEF